MNIILKITASSALALALLGGCSEDADSSGSAGSGAAGEAGSGGAGAGGAGSGGAGSGGAGSGGAGAAGASAGAGGEAGQGGAGGGGAGSGGAGAGDMVADCTEAVAVDLTAGEAAVTTKGFAYDPPCLKIKVGQSVKFTGNSTTHPLAGMSKIGTQPNPLKGPSTVDETVTYEQPGIFGFYCVNHGSQFATGADMAGAVVVVP